MNNIDRLTAMRPDDDTVDSLWPAAARASAINRTFVDPTPLRFRPRRRIRVAVTAAGIAAALAIAVPLVTPIGTPGGASAAAAAELDRLAAIAAEAPYDAIESGQFLHTVTQQWQGEVQFTVQDIETGGKLDQVQPAFRSDIEAWISADGVRWARHTDPDDPRDVEVFRFDNGDGSTGNPTPEFVATLPTDPDELEDWLRDHASGSTSEDEAVFVAIGDILRQGYVAPRLRIALIEVLKRNPKIDLGPATKDSTGRSIVEFDFVDEKNRPGVTQALLFSTETGDVVEEVESEDSKPIFRATTTVKEAVDAVPQAIQDSAQTQ